jgi:hypothetical protein
MTGTRRARRIALALDALVVAMMCFALASLVLPGTELIPERPSMVDFLAVSAIIAVFSGVGSAVTVRRPRNPVGWLFLVMGVAMAGATVTTEYVDRVVYTQATLPGPSLAAWLSSWVWTIGPLVALPLAITLFPEGRLPSHRWRVPVMSALALPITSIGATALAPGPMTGYESHFWNPFGAPGPVGEIAANLARAEEFGLLSFVLPGAFAVAATIVRMRRSRDAERQQLKWLLYPVALFVVGIAIAFATQEPWSWTLALVSFAGVPIAAGIAILRYRLYDIDVVIRRTLVYGAVVAVLAAVYVGLVLVLQAALTELIGGETLPIALSTLTIAALFGPVRARVRALVDRRFYRSRYDAQRTLAVFATRLREEVELEAVGAALVATAGRAVRPTAAAVWLRPGPNR